MSLQCVEQAGPVPFQQLTFEFFEKPVVVETANAALTSDAGLLPIRQFDERIGLTERFAAAIEDCRSVDHVHSVPDMVRSRIYGIIAGYEDQNDHDCLRHDAVFKLIAGRSPDDNPLASQPTLSRFENRISIPDLKRLREATVAQWLDSFRERPRRITLDIDAVDDPTHGEQQLTFFHGYYDQWQYLPLLISHAESGQFVAVSLRYGTAAAALGADDDLEFVVTRIRRRWPEVEIVVRGDCGFGVPIMYQVCERQRLTFTFGIASNKKLQKMTDELLAEAKRRFDQTGEAQRLFAVFPYRAGGWAHERCVVAKVEYNRLGSNRRFVVTNRAGGAILPEGTYDEYVLRGEAENRNKEIKLGLAMDRLSDHRFMANFFRLYLSTAAHNLLMQLRQHVPVPLIASPDPEVVAEALTGRTRRNHQRRQREREPLAKAQPCTWRLGLIKVAAEITVSARRVLVRLAPNWPFLDLYQRIAAIALAAGPS